jgi:hypothetical protein
MQQTKRKIMKVIIKTKSNYRNLNGTIQNVFEIVGTRVTCLIRIEFRLMQVDFHINEVNFI